MKVGIDFRWKMGRRNYDYFVPTISNADFVKIQDCIAHALNLSYINRVPDRGL